MPICHLNADHLTVLPHTCFLVDFYVEQKARSLHLPTCITTPVQADMPTRQTGSSLSSCIIVKQVIIT